ncbi:hypothetical protein MSG28_007865 [Choristoneura fumiferana]|uniref:Uncharacterized protein n=1 Tax=Choristoneura fumiferana TaxID=7141 RepID=A0ACC0J923_CHOFU|nr:hypothetical protein MSG28_007865 [Choristoneura fumiferana]
MSGESSIILVTGGSGLVGQAIKTLIEQEKQEGKNETWIFCGSKDGDLRDKQQTEALFEKHRPTHVIHLAAMVGGLFHNMAHNLDFFRENMAINDNVLAACHSRSVRKVVSCLSTCIFPDNTTYPIDETMRDTQWIRRHPARSARFESYLKRRNTTPSGRSRSAGTSAGGAGYHEQHGRTFTSVIPCNVFGPRDNYSLQSSHVIPALVRRMDDAMRNAARRAFTPVIPALVRRMDDAMRNGWLQHGYAISGAASVYLSHTRASAPYGRRHEKRLVTTRLRDKRRGERLPQSYPR